MKITEIQKEYSKARGQAEQFAPIFRQYQKLAANVVDRRNGSNPFPYGEGTAASLIRKMPQRVLKQMPVGRLRNISDQFMAIMCEFIVEEIFSRNARREAGLIQTLWSIMEAGATYGFCTATPFFTKVNGAYTVDFRTHYWADVMPAPGVKDMNSGDIFIRDWWSKDDILLLLKSAGEDKTLNRKEIAALLQDEPSSRDSENQSETNKRASVSNLGYEVIRYYVREKGRYMLYIFRPDSEDFIQKKELPCRGHVTFYYSPDYLSAYGRSILGLIGGIQIDLDLAQQGKRKVQEIEVDPMIVVKGYTLNKVQIKPKTVIQMPPDSSMEAFSLKTPSLENYSQDHSAGQALIYQLAGYPETNTPGGGSSDGSIGKTPTAIKRAQANIDAADNQVSHNLKLFMEQLFVSSLKIYFDALPEQFLVEVSSEYQSRLLPVAPERFVSDSLVLVKDELDLFDYEIDIESGKDDVNSLRLDSIMKTLGLLEQSPMLASRVMSLGIADDLIKEIVYASGLNNDNISKKLSFLDNVNLMGTGQPGGDPYAGQSIPPEVAMQMSSMAQGNARATGGGDPQNPVVQTQPENPVRQGM